MTKSKAYEIYRNIQLGADMYTQREKAEVGWNVKHFGLNTLRKAFERENKGIQAGSEHANCILFEEVCEEYSDEELMELFNCV